MLPEFAVIEQAQVGRSEFAPKQFHAAVVRCQGDRASAAGLDSKDDVAFFG